MKANLRQCIIDILVGIPLGFAELAKLTGLFTRDGDELRAFADRMRQRLERQPAHNFQLSAAMSIAVLEYDLFGTVPAPGTPAAALINLRALAPNYRPGPRDLPVDVN